MGHDRVFIAKQLQKYTHGNRNILCNAKQVQQHAMHGGIHASVFMPAQKLL